MSTSTLYNVLVGDYTERHFIKSFKRKYCGAWDKTWSAIIETLSRIETFIRLSKLESIHCCDEGSIVKGEFSVAGTNISPHSSGNRYIAYVNEKCKECTILLIYAKTDVDGSNETVWWESEIKDKYPEIAKLFSGLYN